MHLAKLFHAVGLRVVGIDADVFLNDFIAFGFFLLDFADDVRLVLAL